MYYTLAVASEITAAATAVMAVTAIAALAIQFWTSPKPLDAKVALIRTCTEISCPLAIIFGMVLALAGGQSIAPTLLAFYVIVAQTILFLTAGGDDINRYQVGGYVMSMLGPFLLIMVGMMVLLTGQIKDLRQIQGMTTEVLHGVVKALSSGSTPSPSPPPVTK